MLLYRSSRTEDVSSERPRIGLALSGGGFRASIFHLGVIRRLEELGIMPRVDLISAVSGGSIIAAYYVCEMENRLRAEAPGGHASIADRVRIFESIADEFLDATDHNLRTRALVYTPFFHPFAFLKTLISRPFRRTARSELIQKEYDKWFYKNGNTLDDLPSVTPDRARTNVQYGPRLLLNATSLITGERVSFAREPVSKLLEMSKVNKNVLPLARVVGASSGVPGLFPPTAIAGNILVDGGVSDNQGIEALLNEGGGCEVLLVSDASGQLEQLDSVSTSELAVLGRVNSTLMFQVRAKLIEILLAWRQQDQQRQLAFIHLFLNLKDRQEADRLPSEYIPGVARLRTDLDQFSFIETESLMYHGYTLIDAQLRDNCPELVRDSAGAPPLCVPPLFRKGKCDPEVQREIIRADLKAGAQNVYLLRCAQKYRRMGVVLVLGAAAGLVALYYVLLMLPGLLTTTEDLIERFVLGLIPSVARAPVDALLSRLGLTTLNQTVRGLSGLLTLLALGSLTLYLVSFPIYTFVRRYSLYLDKVRYRDITGKDWSLRWASEPGQVVAKMAAGKP